MLVSWPGIREGGTEGRVLLCVSLPPYPHPHPRARFTPSVTDVTWAFPLLQTCALEFKVSRMLALFLYILTDLACRGVCTVCVS